MKTKYLALFVLMAFLIVAALPASAVSEYAIPGTGMIIGVSSDVGVNVTYAQTAPSVGTKVYSNSDNETWIIMPDKSPDGKMNVIISPVDNGFWWWITSWL